MREQIEKAESVISFQCRVERAKETNPDSIDVVSRVSKAVLNTLAMCPSAILRASLTDEASRILGLPVAALTEELDRLRKSGSNGGLKPSIPEIDYDDEFDIGKYGENPSDDVSGVQDMKPILGDVPEKVTPPPARESAFMEF